MADDARIEPDYQEVLDHAPVMIWAAGTDAGCHFFNRPWLEFTGRSLEQEVGDGWVEGVHPDERGAMLATYRKAFDARQPFELEYRLRRRDGQYRVILDRGVVTRDERGEFSGYIGSCIDVTELRDAKRREQRGRELFQSALDGLSCHIALLDRQGRILLVNEAWRRFAANSGLGVPDAGIGASYLEVCDASQGEGAEAAALVAAGIRDVLAGRRDAFQTEYVCHSPEGDLWFLVRGSALDRDGGAAIVVEHTDVTALRVAEQARAQFEIQARESQRLESLGVLAGGIAHDFNNLLTVILGNSRLALDDLSADAPARGRIARVRGAADQATRLTEQMLTYAGKGTVELEPVNLAQTVREMRTLLDSCLQGRGVLELHTNDPLPAVDADPTQMRQLVLNLVINAAESMERADGRVTVRTGSARVDAAELAESFGARGLQPGEYVVLEVSDDGLGIEPEQRARLFEPFFSTKRGGRGLGLSVVLGIARGHRGAVRVDSEPGRGTSFRVLLPPSPSAVEARVDDASIAVEVRPTILVVDDDDLVREVAEAFLQRADFEVICASGGREAIEILRAKRDRISAVVLDLAMPEMNGASTSMALRRIRSDLPILFVSGFSREQAGERFPDVDSSELLRKPYEPEVLVERICALL